LRNSAQAHLLRAVIAWRISGLGRHTGEPSTCYIYIQQGRVGQPTLPPSIVGHHNGRDDGGVPGVVVVFSDGAPATRVMALASGPLELGRDADAGKVDDGRVSRRHALVAFEGTRCIVTDLGSQNGTLVDGALAVAHMPTPAQRVIRIGDSLLVPYADVRSFECVREHWCVRGRVGAVGPVGAAPGWRRAQGRRARSAGSRLGASASAKLAPKY
jgi:hypothetical protein